MINYEKIGVWLSLKRASEGKIHITDSIVYSTEFEGFYISRRKIGCDTINIHDIIRTKDTIIELYQWFNDTEKAEMTAILLGSND